MQQGVWSFFCSVNIIGWQLASATVLKLKITLTRASRSCLHIKNSSLSSQLYYNSVHCDIQTYYGSISLLVMILLLVNIPQRLLGLNLALKGAGQPDDQELTNCHSYSNPNYRIEVILNEGLNPRDAPLCVDLQHCFCFSLLLQNPGCPWRVLHSKTTHKVDQV